MEKQRLEQIERYVLGFLKEQQHARILAKELFASTSTYANADIVRALEDLEKKERLLVRHTSEGNDYISLTPRESNASVSSRQTSKTTLGPFLIPQRAPRSLCKSSLEV